MNQFLTSVFLLSTLISLGNCLECYHCDSSQSYLCNMGLFSFAMPTIDCSKQTGNEEANVLTSWIPKQCVKITAKDSDGKDYVARGCIPYSGSACNLVLKTLGFLSELSGGARDVNCHTCDGDKCNSSINFHASIGVTLAASILSVFFKL